MVTRTKKIFVGGLSAPTTLEDVKNYFEQFGRVSTFLPTKSITHVSHSIAISNSAIKGTLNIGGYIKASWKIRLCLKFSVQSWIDLAHYLVMLGLTQVSSQREKGRSQREKGQSQRALARAS